MTTFAPRLSRIVIAILTFISVGGVAFAHSGATGMVKDRMNLMKDLGAAMKDMAAMLRGKTNYDADRIRKLATEMQAHSLHIPKMFPEGSDKKPSEAKATIWSEPEDFTKSAKELGNHARTLAEKAEDKFAAMAAFRDIGKTCKSCHTDYREKKN